MSHRSARPRDGSTGGFSPLIIDFVSAVSNAELGIKKDIQSAEESNRFDCAHGEISALVVRLQPHKKELNVAS